MSESDCELCNETFQMRDEDSDPPFLCDPCAQRIAGGVWTSISNEIRLRHILNMERDAEQERRHFDAHRADTLACRVDELERENTRLRQSFADEEERLRAEHEASLIAWMETGRNVGYYIGLLDQIAAHLGPVAFVSDDGTRVRDKLPGLVEALVTLVQEFEWSAGDAGGECPDCCGTKKTGHYHFCRLAPKIHAMGK